MATAATMVVVCPGCGARNRVEATAAQQRQPVCGRCGQALPAAPTGPVTVTDANFSQTVESSPLPVLLDMWAAWCGPCRIIAPTIEALATELAGKAVVGKLDVDGQAVSKGAVLRIGMRANLLTEGRIDCANGDKISAKVVINAAGTAAPQLSPQLRIVKRKGHLVITDRYPGFIRRQLIELGYLRSAHGRDSDSVAFNVQPRKTGQILLGSSRQFGSDTGEIDHAIVRRMAERAFKYMPSIRRLNAIRTWTGFRPATPDNLPYIGRIPGFENLYAAVGHEGLGITTSLGTAELLTSEILGRKPAISLTPYNPSRIFSEH